MKHFYWRLVFFTVFLTSTVSAAPLYKPYIDGSPALDMDGSTYCLKKDAERFLWTTINKYANSILSVFPRVPPDQLSYLDAERASGDSERATHAFMNPYTRVKEIIVTGQMLEKVTKDVIKGYEFLTLPNKVLIATISLKSIRNRELNLNNIDYLEDALKRKGFNINRENLSSFVFTNYLLEDTLIDYLQCLGIAGSR